MLPRPHVYVDGALPQSLCAIVLFALMLALQMHVRPYAQRWVAAMYDASALVLIATAALALAAHSARVSGMPGGDVLAVLAAVALAVPNAVLLIVLIAATLVSKVRKRRPGWRDASSAEHRLGRGEGGRGARGGSADARAKLRTLFARVVHFVEPYVSERWAKGTFVPESDLELVWTYTGEKLKKVAAGEKRKRDVAAITAAEARAATGQKPKLIKPSAERAGETTAAMNASRTAVVPAPAGLRPVWLDPACDAVAYDQMQTLDLLRVPPPKGCVLAFVDSVGERVDLEWRRRHAGVEPAWRSRGGESGREGVVIDTADIPDRYRPRIEWRNDAARTFADVAPESASRVADHIAGQNFDADTIGVRVGLHALNPLAAARMNQRPEPQGGGSEHGMLNPHRRASLQDHAHHHRFSNDASHDAAQQRRASAASMTTAQRAAAARARRISMTMGVPIGAIGHLTLPAAGAFDGPTPQAAVSAGVELQQLSRVPLVGVNARRVSFSAETSARTVSPPPRPPSPPTPAVPGKEERQQAIAEYRRAERRASRARDVTSGTAFLDGNDMAN